MIKMYKIFAMLILATLFSACSWESIEPATKGKILTTSGYLPDVLEPGRYTLWGRQKLIKLETNTNTFTEQVTVKLADKLELTAEVRFRGRIAGDEKTINSMFNDISAGEDALVSFNEVYRIYGQMVVRNVTREIINPYNVDEVHQNYNRLSEEIGTALVTALTGTPLEISDVALGNIEYPPVVVAAINAAEERRLSIQKEEAQAQILLVQKENERAVAEADYEVQLTNARAIRDRNSTIAEGLSPEILQLRYIEAIEKMADNKSAVFLPFESLQSQGAQMRMFNQTALK